MKQRPNVRVRSTYGVGRGTTVELGKWDEDAASFTPIGLVPDVTAINVARITPEDPVLITVEIQVASLDISGTAEIIMVDPVSEERRRVAKIVFEDGSEFVAIPPGS